MLGQELRAGRRSSLSPGDGVKRMAEAAGQGDRLARELFQRAGRALGRAFSLTATAAGLDLMVIGGGAAPAWPFMESQARIELSQNLHMVDPAAVELAQSRLGDDAPLLGAAAFAESTFATSAG
jgi:glucokinase